MPRLFRYMRGMSRSRRWLTGRMDDLLIKANAGSHADLEALALLMYSGEASMSQRRLQDELGLSQPRNLATGGTTRRIRDGASHSESNGGRSAELGLTDKARQVMTRIGPEYAAHVEAAARVVAEMVAESGVLSRRGRRDGDGREPVGCRRGAVGARARRGPCGRRSRAAALPFGPATEVAGRSRRTRRLRHRRPCVRMGGSSVGQQGGCVVPGRLSAAQLRAVS